MRLALVIDRLNCGGSERQFAVLASALQQRGHQVLGLVFYPGGPFAQELQTAGVRLRVLNKRGRWDVWRFGRELAHVAREERPHVMYGFSSVPNVAVALMRPVVPDMRVVWGVRASNVPLARYGWLPPLVGRVAVHLSTRADLVIANSYAGLADAVGRGYRPQKMTVIPNGIDVDRFAPCSESGRQIRAAWNVEPSSTLIGIVGRLDPMKGHPVFLDAAAQLAACRPNLQFVCVGDGSSAYRAQLQDQAARLGIADRVRWVAHVADMPAVYNALDVLCSASIDGEGFPNVVGEAMACGTLCVVTDVGDSARVLNCPLLTAPPGDPESLAARVSAVLDMPGRQRAGVAAQGRCRIESEFSVTHLVDATENAILETLNEPRY